MERVNPGALLAADWGMLEDAPGAVGLTSDVPPRVLPGWEEAAPVGCGAERFCELG